MCVCVCVCARVGKQPMEKDKERMTFYQPGVHSYTYFLFRDLQQMWDRESEIKERGMEKKENRGMVSERLKERWY